MNTEKYIKILQAALIARGLPVNLTDDPKGTGLHLWEERHALYKSKKSAKIVGYREIGKIGIVYNAPSDGQGGVIRYGIQAIYDETLLVLQELGYQYKTAPFGLSVSPK